MISCATKSETLPDGLEVVAVALRRRRGTARQGLMVRDIVFMLEVNYCRNRPLVGNYNTFA
jgi:hypothetical protein